MFEKEKSIRMDKFRVIHLRNLAGTTILLNADTRKNKNHSPKSERQSYGDAAIGYVQVKRDGSGICIVKARITPEHNVRLKCYAVTAIYNENVKINSVTCEDCSAHLGRC
ncbi:hypothetical protein ABMA28_003116 [Loxostege sticticalis]|uniref:Transposase n=1 Tax=Loxostege sticticalis TaxID=481309 RepID=A0ABD0SV95_LOXSC